ncbi:hypothetical protein PMAG_a3117 [Pseudoalteromonas mariniglutinosa NCIMB 1770]|nr:hypothetical protein [Pseudoalteromonas mariniglutinosa NCIMB 1770]
MVKYLSRLVLVQQPHFKSKKTALEYYSKAVFCKLKLNYGRGMKPNAS